MNATMMQSVSLAACRLIFILMCAPAYADACRSFTVSAGTEGWHPLTYRDVKTPQINRLSQDFAMLIAKAIQIQVTVNHLPRERLLESLKDGTLDMAIAVYLNAERDQYLVYSDPYFDDATTIFVENVPEFLFTR